MIGEKVPAGLVGYEFLRTLFALKTVPPARSARVAKVTRITPFGTDVLAVPAHEAQRIGVPAVPLQSFSRPSRQLWQVAVENDDVRASFEGPEEIYRYWDATACVEFRLRMSEQALTRDLREESDFIHRFDRAWRAINDRVDIANNDLVILTRSILQNKGALSNSRRRQFLAKGYTSEILSAAEQAAREVLIDEGRSSERPEG